MKVFVYGTLKRGFNNHHLMKGKFLGERRTLKRFSMFDAGFPVLLEDLPFSYPCHQIHGELYQVTGDTMKTLDKLEANEQMYERQLTSVYGDTNAASDLAWVYVGKLPFWIDNEWEPKDVIRHWP